MESQVEAVGGGEGDGCIAAVGSVSSGRPVSVGRVKWMRNLPNLSDGGFGIDRFVGVPVVRDPPGRMIGGENEVGIFGQKFVVFESVLRFDASAKAQAVVEHSEGDSRIGSTVLVSDEDGRLVTVINDGLVLSPEGMPGLSNLSLLLAHDLTIGAYRWDISELEAQGRGLQNRLVFSIDLVGELSVSIDEDGRF